MRVHVLSMDGESTRISVTALDRNGVERTIPIELSHDAKTDDLCVVLERDADSKVLYSGPLTYHKETK